MKLQIVLDTNVFISALRSDKGASFRLFSLLGNGRFDINISVPLVLEYEEVAQRQAEELGLTTQDIDDVLDYICAVARQRLIFFLWRPYLKDTEDDHILELAFEAECNYIVTYNVRDFSGVEQFGIQVVTPVQFLQRIGELP